VVHGYAARASAHWFPWLGEHLTARGITCTVVELPTPESPDAAAWEHAVAAAVGTPDEGTWIVAHSLGAITALRALEALPEGTRVGGLVMVAGFTGPLAALPVLDDYLRDDIDATKLVPRVGTRIMVHSDDDALVPPDASDRLARRLRAEVYLQRGAGHFLAEDGVVSLPLIATLLDRASGG
jgi:predicted alpha/beta hydrolase family esterase